MKLLHSPYFLTLLALIILTISIPWNLPPRQLSREPVTKILVQEHEQYGVADKGDGGNSEFFRFKKNNNGGESIVTENMLFSPINQIDFKGTIQYSGSDALIIDADQNHQADIAFLSSYKDSMYVVICYNAWVNQDSIVYLPVDEYKADRMSGPNNFLADYMDLDGDGDHEFIAILNAGFQIRPRAVYIIPDNGEPLKSYKQGINTYNYIGAWDIDQDGKKEIFVTSKAVMNVAPSDSIKETDYFSRFTVLTPNGDQKYDLLIKNHGKYNRVTTAPVVVQNDTLVLAICHSADLPTRLLFYHPKSGKLDSLTQKRHHPLPIGLDIYFIRGFNHYVLTSSDGQFFVLKNNHLQRIKQLERYEKVLNQRWPYPTKSTELVMMNIFDSTLFISDNKRLITNKVHIPPPNQESPIKANAELQVFDKPGLFLQIGNHILVYTEKSNLWYHARYPAAVLLYGLLSLFIYLIRYQQKKAIRKKQKIQEEIQSLQYRAINNQLNPHFSFNMLNIIGYSIMNEERDKAYEMLTQYAKLTRELVETGHQITTRLYTEVRFVENYLNLQKIRFEHTLEYSIQIESSVDQTILIPKMMLHTFVENAIKHGLSEISSIKKIKIDIRNNDPGITILIEDNGVGLENSKGNNHDSTGKGLEILSQILDLFKQLTGQRVKFQMHNLEDLDPQKTGTRVEILLS